MVNNHELGWYFFPKKELTQIYLSSALHHFAVSLLGIFVPLYLHQNMNYSLAETLYFFIFYALIFAISTPLAAKVASAYGMKHTIFLSIPFYVAFVFLLYLLPSRAAPLFIIAALAGVSQALYWMGLHLVFFHASSRHSRGKEVGIRQAVSVGATVFGPLVGGFLITTFGFNLVFALSAVILFFSALILFLSKENHLHYSFSLRSLINSQWRNSLYFVSRGVAVMAGGVIWPLFIFVILKDYFLLGVVGSLIPAISAILLWLVGMYSDHVDKRTIIRFVAGFESLSWFLRAFVTTVGQVFGVTLFGAVTHGIIESPLSALEYDKAKRDVPAYFVNRELFICLGRILVLVFVLMTNSLSEGLIFNAVTNFMVLLF